MSVKSILTLFSGYKDNIPALEGALNLGRALRATVRVLHVARPPVPDLAASGIYGGIGFSDAGLIETLDRSEAELASAAETQVRACCHHAGIALLAADDSGVMGQAQAVFRTVVDDVRLALQREAATTDLIVLAHDNRPVGDFEAVLAGLFDARRPVLLLPRYPGQSWFEHGFSGPAMIAWDGSPACGRALHEAVPLLLHAAGIYLVSVTEGGTAKGDDDAMAYLHSHCLGAERVRVERGHRKTGEILLTEADRLGAHLLVMGAYGPGHVGEMLLGGTSDHILKHATVPLLLAH